MAKPKHGAVSFIIVIAVIYLLVRYWTNITAAVAPTLAAVAPATTPATTLPIINMASGAPGDPAFSAAFGGSGNGFSGSLFAGPAAIRAGGLGAGTPGFTQSNGAQGDPRIGTVPTGFGNCSTSPTDGKLLCA